MTEFTNTLKRKVTLPKNKANKIILSPEMKNVSKPS